MSCENRAAGINNLPKPKLRGHCMASFNRHVIMAVTLGGVAAFIFNILYCKPRQQRYVDFHKNYDPVKDEERMTALGLFQSASVGYDAPSAENETTEPEVSNEES